MGKFMWNKPLPSIDPDIEPIFRAYTDHEYSLWRCKICGEWYFWKTQCDSHDTHPNFEHLELREASGQGTVFATITTHRAWHPGFEDELPYDLSLIELDEGPIVASQVIGIDPSDVSVGMDVEVTFKDIPAEEIADEKMVRFPLKDGFTLPYFTPRGETA
jgi:uncharacterized OB-fold protein